MAASESAQASSVTVRWFRTLDRTKTPQEARPERLERSRSEVWTLVLPMGGVACSKVGRIHFSF